MSNDLRDLIDRAKSIAMTLAEQEEQRRSFAFGNTSFENASITMRMVNEVASRLGQPADALTRARASRSTRATR